MNDIKQQPSGRTCLNGHPLVEGQPYCARCGSYPARRGREARNALQPSRRTQWAAHLPRLPAVQRRAKIILAVVMVGALVVLVLVKVTGSTTHRVSFNVYGERRGSTNESCLLTPYLEADKPVLDSRVTLRGSDGDVLFTSTFVDVRSGTRLADGCLWSLVADDVADDDAYELTTEVPGEEPQTSTLSRQELEDRDWSVSVN